MVAVCAIYVRDVGLPLALQLLFYPGCAAHQDSQPHRLFAQGFIFDHADIGWFSSRYLRTSADRDDWRFAPLCADFLV